MGDFKVIAKTVIAKTVIAKIVKNIRAIVAYLQHQDYRRRR